MKAVILVGGEGTRLRPLTYNIVKAMVPILNRPFLEHMFHYLKGYGVDDVILALCYLPDSIRDYFGEGDRVGLNLTYVREESPLGTAGAVKNAEKYLDESFLVFNGDVFTTIDLGAMLQFHRQKKATATIALTPVEDPSLYGVVEMDNNRRILRFIEKPPQETDKMGGKAKPSLINAGIYILEPEVLSGIPPQRHFMFEHHLFPSLLDNGSPIYGYPSDAYWIDMGTPQKYLRLHHDLLCGRVSGFDAEKKVSEGVRSWGGDIHPDAHIEGAVLLGERCRISQGAYVRGPVVMGNDCCISEEAFIEGAVLWGGITVGKGAVLRNCIVGKGVSIGENCHVLDGEVLGDNTV